MQISERVLRAVHNYAGLPGVHLEPGITPDDVYLASPNRLAYALGWCAANEIVNARYRAAIDALPIYHHEHGWDRFLLTRRVSCSLLAEEPANRFGMLMLDGEDAPRLTTPGGTTKIALGSLLQTDPEMAVTELLRLVPMPQLREGNHGRCPHERAERYPLYFGAVTDLIVDYPGLVASREIYVDNEQIDNQFHPLYLHAITLQPTGPGDRHGLIMPGVVHDWFQLQYGDLFAFFDIYGSRAIYRTDRGTWARVRQQLADTSDEDVKDRIAAWLRLDDRQPDPEID